MSSSSPQPKPRQDPRSKAIRGLIMDMHRHPAKHKKWMDRVERLHEIMYGKDGKPGKMNRSASPRKKQPPRRRLSQIDDAFWWDKH